LRLRNIHFLKAKKIEIAMAKAMKAMKAKSSKAMKAMKVMKKKEAMKSSKMAKAQQEKPAGSLDYKKMPRIRGVSYPGRVVCLGKKEDGTLVQVYSIMGRSANSRNRIFAVQAGTGQVYTEAADASKVEDPSLIIYNALTELNKQYIVTNGDQTDTIHAALSKGQTFEEGLRTRAHEPDRPNYTPRISGLFDLRGGVCKAKISVIRKNAFDNTGNVSDHQFYEYDFSKACFDGKGLVVTTYMGDGNPLPSFEGNPFAVPIKGSADQIADFFWRALDKDNKVSLVVKEINPQTGATFVTIRNKYKKVSC